jgi:hypothetical protein
LNNAAGVCEAVHFRPAPALAPRAIAIICEQVRLRMLRWFARSGLLDSDYVRDMLGWDNGGFSLDASVWPDPVVWNVRYEESGHSPPVAR